DMQIATISNRLRFLVRKKVEKLGVSPERCLLYIASCFDQEADWDAVMHIVRNKGKRAPVEAKPSKTKTKKLKGEKEIEKEMEKRAADKMIAQWQSLSEEQWGDALENLV